MPKKDISKILAKGSIKQKLNLIAENNARGFFGHDMLLSKREEKEISDSFKKPGEIKKWNEFLKHARKVGGAITNLQGLLFEVKMNYSNLRGYILVWNTIENAELLVNSVLHEVNDVKERKQIAEKGAEGIEMLFSKTSSDEEGYLDIEIDFTRKKYNKENYKEEPVNTKEYSLLNVMNNVREEANLSIVKFISWRDAIIDYMEEEDLDNFTEQVYKPVIGWPKYEGVFDIGIDNPQIDKLIGKYNITPDIESLKANDEVYKSFKDQFL